MSLFNQPGYSLHSTETQICYSIRKKNKIKKEKKKEKKKKIATLLLYRRENKLPWN